MGKRRFHGNDKSERLFPPEGTLANEIAESGGGSVKKKRAEKVCQ